MKRLVLALMALSLSDGAFGQRRVGPYWSLGGYGNVLFPGTGHAPGAVPGGPTGGYLRQWAGSSRTDSRWQVPPIVTVPSPVFDGGYSEDRSGNNPINELGTMSPINTSPAPPVIINQSLVPPPGNIRTGDSKSSDEMQSCAIPQGEPRGVKVVQDRPTIYLIAFKDHSIVQALGYWMETGTLHYVTAEYSVNQASLVLIDGDLSQRLNDERGIAFQLPVQK